jgi:MYXO-CTERM domain-containing protein
MSVSSAPLETRRNLGWTLALIALAMLGVAIRRRSR